MIFSSASFLFAFLPCVAIVYYLLRSRTARNVFLTLVSLFFYAWGEPWFVLVMLLSIVINWFIALRIGAGEHKKAWLVVGLVCDLGLLAVFKYLGFLMENVNWIFRLSLPVPQIVLPIGISFFPQLIAGPIVRYQTFDDQITTRRETLDDFCEGVRRFIVGLAKKVLLANNLAALADTAFAMKTTELSLVGTWLAAASYMLQLYFDFSGYSDMAIGLARMFGFHFLENYNMPFIARSIAGVWKRWHISLTSWFRDYLYFPLGGSRVSKGRLLFNMGVVWVLTGFWHGAQWTYLAWGFLFFVLQAFERFSGAGKWLEKHRIGHLYVFLVVMIASVVSRADSIPHALDLYRSMFGLDGSAIFDDTARMFLREYGVFLAAGVLCCLPVPKRIPDAVRGVGLAVAGFVAITYVVMGSYNPVI